MEHSQNNDYSTTSVDKVLMRLNKMKRNEIVDQCREGDGNIKCDNSHKKRLDKHILRNKTLRVIRQRTFPTFSGCK